jgi:hypothetical protein
LLPSLEPTFTDGSEKEIRTIPPVKAPTMAPSFSSPPSIGGWEYPSQIPSSLPSVESSLTNGGGGAVEVVPTLGPSASPAPSVISSGSPSVLPSEEPSTISEMTQPAQSVIQAPSGTITPRLEDVSAQPVGGTMVFPMDDMSDTPRDQVDNDTESDEKPIMYDNDDEYTTEIDGRQETNNDGEVGMKEYPTFENDEYQTFDFEGHAASTSRQEAKNDPNVDKND